MRHADPKAFIENSSKYAPIGATLVALSNLEYAHDKFCLKYYELNKEFALEISKRFPRQYRDKVDFLIKAVLRDASLKREPMFQDGTLNLQWLQYQLDELYEIRTTLAHGSIFYSKTIGEFSMWQFDRITSFEKSTWGEKGVRIGSSFLADAYITSLNIKHYLVRLVGVLDRRDDWETDYKAQIQIQRNRGELRELAEFGIIDCNPFLQSLLEDGETHG